MYTESIFLLMNVAKSRRFIEKGCLFVRLLSVWAAPILLLCMNLDEVLQIKSLDVVVSLCIQQSEVIMHIFRIGLVVVNLSVSRIPK